MAASAVLMCGSAHTGIVSEMAVDATNGSLPSMSLEKSPAFAAQVVVEMYHGTLLYVLRVDYG